MESDRNVPAAEPPGRPSDAPADPVKAVHSPWYTHIPHTYIAVRKAQGPVKIADQLDRASPIARLNSRTALLITVAVGSMWCAYLFTLLAFVSLPSAIGTHNTIVIVAWIAQTFLQLVLLPVIIVGQNVQGQASDKRAVQTYNDAEAILHEAIQIQQHLAVQDVQLHAQSQRLEEIITALQKAYPAVVGASAPAGNE
jgi:hypothetical protein